MAYTPEQVKQAVDSGVSEAELSAESAKFPDINADAATGNVLESRRKQAAATAIQPIEQKLTIAGAPRDPYLERYFDANGNPKDPKDPTYGRLPSEGPAPSSGASTSDAYRTGIADTGSQVATSEAASARAAGDAVDVLLSDREKQLEQRRKDTEGQIEQNYQVSRANAERSQQQETGAASMGLATIGGYLGESASGQAYMRSLAGRQREELAALESQRQQALLSARAAFEDKQFDLAMAKVQNIKDVEQKIFERKQATIDNILKLNQIKKYERETASETISALTASGIEIADLPEGYMESLDEAMGYPTGVAAAMWEVGQDERLKANAKSRLELEGMVIDQTQKIIDIQKKVPYGTPIRVGDTTYVGLDTGDVSTQIETDDAGMARGVTYNKSTGAWGVTDLGYIGSKKDGFELQIDKYGRPWNYNKKTGQFYSATIPGQQAQGVSSANWQSLIPEGTVWGASWKRSSAGQCGALVNDLTKIGVGDTLESKVAKIDKSISLDAGTVQVGDVAVFKGGTTGHVAIVNAVITDSPDGKSYIRLTESNWNGDLKATHTRQVPADDPSLLGFGRGQLDPRLNTGPDALPPYPVFAGQQGPQGTLVERGGVTYNVVNGVATPVMISGGGSLGAEAEPDRVVGNQILRKGPNGAYSAVYTLPKDMEETKELRIVDNLPYIYDKATQQLTPAPVKTPDGGVKYLKADELVSDPQDIQIQDLSKRYAAATTETERASITNQAKDLGRDPNAVVREAGKIGQPKGRIVSSTTGLASEPPEATTVRINTASTIANDLLPRMRGILVANPDLSTGTYANIIIKKLPKEFRTALEDQISSIASSIQTEYFFAKSGAQVSPEEEKRLKESVPSTDATVSQNLARIRTFKTTMLDIIGRELRSRGLKVSGEEVTVRRKSDGLPGTIPVDEFNSANYEILL